MKLKSSQLICLGFIIGLLSLPTNCFAGATDDGGQNAGIQHMAAAPVDNEDEEDDEEEEAVDYRDRVREIQDWMSRRDAERKQAQGLDIPQAASPTLSPPFPRYFKDNDYDENGYRRLGDDVRVKLRNEPEASSYPYGSHGHSSWRLMRHGYGYPSGRHASWHSSRHSYGRYDYLRHHSTGKSKSGEKRHSRR